MTSGGLPMYDYLNKPAVVASQSVFTGLAIICNSFIIITILLSSLRTSAKHLAVLALCLVDLYEACSSMALFAELYDLEEHIHPQYLFYLDFSQFPMLSSFRTFLMITICLVTLISMFTVNKSFLNLMSVSMVFASLFYSLVLILPKSPRYEDLNVYHMSKCIEENVRLFIQTSFLPPATILIVLLINILIVSCCFTRDFENADFGLRKKIPVDVLVAAVVFLIITIPVVVWSYVPQCMGREKCEGLFTAKFAFMQLFEARHFIQPLLWLLCPDVRHAAIYCCRRSNEPVIHPSNQAAYQPNIQPPYQAYNQPVNQYNTQQLNQPNKQVYDMQTLSARI